MAFQQAIIMAPIIASILIPMASATAGTSTFYTTYVPSACYGYSDQGTLIAAVPQNLYDGGQACGRSYRIRCTGGTKSGQNPCRGGDVVVKVVDLCPGCADNQIDLSQQAFSTIGNADAGRIRINFTLLTDRPTHADAPSSPRSGYGLAPAPSAGYHPQDPGYNSHPEIYIIDTGKARTKIIIGVLLGVAGMIILSISVCCILKRLGSVSSPNPESKHDVERILLQWGSLTPKRYKYSEIKKMTKSMDDKLGEGGYGSVYKGMLPDGVPVAVKVLTDTESNGEDFINEVASISRTSHVNIVALLGFCYEGTRRALVYEYMPNSSLDKFLNHNQSDSRLDLEKLYKIAVGIAKGLEYLHKGCTTRIVHFDIKPQNILLDEDFCPKISDFGLAKLCKKKQSVLSVVGMRGTIGYIAPEVFSRNFGGVSHKSDVYSYGMMILEMAGVGKAEVIRSSENYFPDRIYEQVISEVGNGLNMIEEKEEKRKKMILVGFWCIQTNPMSRPSISHVLEMLEGSLESIQIPPKPFLFTPPNIPTHQDEVSSSFVDTAENSGVDEIVTLELPS